MPIRVWDPQQVAMSRIPWTLRAAFAWCVPSKAGSRSAGGARQCARDDRPRGAKNAAPRPGHENAARLLPHHPGWL
jgi:hypothetical protein